jgi:hypothetical protein
MEGGKNEFQLFMCLSKIAARSAVDFSARSASTRSSEGCL